MKKLSIAMVSVLALAAFSGCKKKKDGDEAAAGSAAPAVTEGATCEVAVAKGMAVYGPEMAKEMPPTAQPHMAEIQKLMSDAALASCKEDKWPAEAINCYASAGDKAAMDACDAKFTAVDQQMKARMKALEPKMAELMGAPAAAGSGAAPAGEPAATGAAPAGEPAATGAAPAGEPAATGAAPAGEPAATGK